MCVLSGGMGYLFESKGMEKRFHANGNDKKLGGEIFISALKATGIPAVVQQVKDLALFLWQLGFNPWPRNLYMPLVQL